MEREALMDTGARISIMPEYIYQAIHPAYRQPLWKTDRIIYAGNRTKVDVKGVTTIQISIHKRVFRYKFYVCADARHPILGIDFQEDRHVHIEPGTRKAWINENGVYTEFPCFSSEAYSTRSRVTMVENYTIQPNTEVILPACVKGGVHHEDKAMMLNRLDTCFNKTGAIVCSAVVKPKQGQVPLRLLNATNEPIKLHKGAVMAVAEPVYQCTLWDGKEEERGQCECKCTCRANRGKIPVQTFELCCHNLDQQESVIEKYDYVMSMSTDGESRQFEEFEVDETVPGHVKELYLESLVRLKTNQQRNRLAGILKDYSDCFARHADDIGRTQMIKHKIETGDAKPVRQRCRRLARSQVQAIQDYVKVHSAAGTIRPSNSNWGANCVVVKKKTGEDRVCIDYRGLNAVTLNPDSYLLPRIDDTLDALANAKYFCTLDLIQGYHQVELEEESKEKTSFYAPHCNPSQWEYNFMPFGLIKAPRTFQRLMDRVIQGLEYEIALAYLDDVIVFGPTLDVTMDRMVTVLERLRSANLKLKAKKCILFSKKVNYLGHVITAEGVMTDPKKIEAVVNWHVPRTVRQVRAFMGMINYYSRFIPNLQHIARPLHDITKKNAKFKWTNAHNEAFQTLKQKLVSAPIMSYPKKEGMFILDTDASDKCYGAVLSQLQTDEYGNVEEKTIAYASKVFKERESKYCARRRELLAIINFVKHFDVYLRGPTFLIRTDHASLRYIKTVQTLPAQFFRWIMLLEEYSYKIEIRKGVLHGNADGMSRGCHGNGCICDELEAYEKKFNVKKHDVLDGDEVEVKAFYCNNFVAKTIDQECQRGDCTVTAYKLNPSYAAEEIAEMQRKDPDIEPVLTRFIENPEEKPDWNSISEYSRAAKSYFAEWKRLKLINHVLYRIWESANGLNKCYQIIAPRQLQEKLMERVHDGKVAAHMGRHKTTHALLHFCFWHRMSNDVAFWIASCDKCQRRKPAQPAPKAPMKLNISGEPNERVQMDICGPLITTERGNKHILVITDTFTKYTQAYAMPNQEAETVADILVNNWICRYGQPEQLHTDQGANFGSKLIKELCEVHGIEKTRTTAYYPQGDGQVERFNKTMMNVVYALVDKTHGDWDVVLKYVNAAYNGTVHDVTRSTPNFLWYGREMRFTIGSIVPDHGEEKSKDYVEYVKKMRARLQLAYDITREALKKRAVTAKKYYDRNMNEIHHKAGTLVMIRDHTPKDKGDKKMCYQFSGPYWVVDRVGPTSIRIIDGEDGRYQIVHHNRVKPYTSRQVVVIPRWLRKISKELNELEDIVSEEQQLVDKAVTEMPAIRLGKQRKVVKRKGESVKMNPRRGRPKNAPKPRQVEEPKLLPVICEEETADRVDTAPTRKSRAGRIVKRPSRYL